MVSVKTPKPKVRIWTGRGLDQCLFASCNAQSKGGFEGDLRLFSCFGAHWGPSRLHTSEAQPFDGHRTCSLQSIVPPLPSPEQPAHCERVLLTL